MAFLCDNAGTLNCYKLRTFVLLKMSGCLRKQVVYFDSFHSFRLVAPPPATGLSVVSGAMVRGKSFSRNRN